METGRGDINNIRVTYEKMERENIEYSSHTLSEVVDGEKLMTGSWSQRPGLEIKKTIKKLIQRRIINHIVLPSTMSISVICKIISGEQIFTKRRQYKQD